MTGGPGAGRPRRGDGAYRAPWWCRNPHLQTAWGTLFRHRRLPLRRERVTLADGDFVDLDWLDGPPGTPLLLVLHGLEGSSRSSYVTGLLGHGAHAGWRGAALNFRACSGELNRLPRFYHSGDTGDLDQVVRQLVDREPGLRIGVVGVSLGGNVLLKWLGERGEGTPAAVVAAAAISVPFDLVRSVDVLDRGFRKQVYTRRFMRSMRRKVVAKARRYPGFVDVAAARRARTFAEYDQVVTAPLEGFADAMDYWVRASSRPYVGHVRRPTLLLSARDDPLVPTAALPDPATLPPDVLAEFTIEGGHVGFVEGRWPWRAGSWAERRAVEFLCSVVKASPDPVGRLGGTALTGGGAAGAAMVKGARS